MLFFRVVLAALILSSVVHAANPPPVQTVFVILLENHNWSSYKGSVDAPYLNGTLLLRASY